MIGYGLKKLAKENNLKISHGIAFGNFQDYAVALSEGMGYKKLAITTTFPDIERRDGLRRTLAQQNVRKDFRVTELLFTSEGILVTFYDNIGTMKKMRNFIQWFFPLLKESGATGVSICTHCGNEITSGCWKLLDGAAYHLHDDCGDSLRQSLAASQEVTNAEKTGSYLSGFLGALGGAAIGTLVWAVVLMMGYVASVVGFLIGWLAERGYNRFHGKQGKGKIAILIVTVILSVLLGTVAADVLSLAKMIYDGELVGFVFGDIPWLLLVLLQDGEYLAGMGHNILLGLVFAALGVYTLIHKAGKAVADRKIIDLE